MWWVRVRFLPPLVVAATVLAGFGLGHCPGCCGARAVPAAGRDSGQRDHIGSLPSSRAVPASAGTDRIVVTAVAAAVGSGPIRAAGPISFAEDVPLQHDDSMAHGWPVKTLWPVRQHTRGKVRLSGHDLSTGQPVWFSVSTLSRHPVLNWRHPTAAAGPQEGWSQFASQVIFPGAGCYRIRATWARASWTLTVGVGL